MQNPSTRYLAAKFNNPSKTRINSSTNTTNNQTLIEPTTVKTKHTEVPKTKSPKISDHQINSQPTLSTKMSTYENNINIKSKNSFNNNNNNRRFNNPNTGYTPQDLTTGVANNSNTLINQVNLQNSSNTGYIPANKHVQNIQAVMNTKSDITLNNGYFANTNSNNNGSNTNNSHGHNNNKPINSISTGYSPSKSKHLNQANLPHVATAEDIKKLTSSGNVNYYTIEGKNIDKCQYLKQLMQDRTVIQKIKETNTAAFHHVDRLLEDEINRVRSALFNTENQPLTLPEGVGQPVTLTEKIYVPVDKHPEYNFVGRILGPRGLTAKQLEQETQCKIMVRGEGSMRDKRSEDAKRGNKHWEHLSEPLHVLITVEDCENRAKIKMEKAKKEIQKLMIPQQDGEDGLKKKQLMELAILNGTYRDNTPIKHNKNLSVHSLPNNAIAAITNNAASHTATYGPVNTAGGPLMVAGVTTQPIHILNPNSQLIQQTQNNLTPILNPSAAPYTPQSRATTQNNVIYNSFTPIQNNHRNNSASQPLAHTATPFAPASTNPAATSNNSPSMAENSTEQTANSPNNLNNNSHRNSVSHQISTTQVMIGGKDNSNTGKDETSANNNNANNNTTTENATNNIQNATNLVAFSTANGTVTSMADTVSKTNTTNSNNNTNSVSSNANQITHATHAQFLPQTQTFTTQYIDAHNNQYIPAVQFAPTFATNGNLPASIIYQPQYPIFNNANTLTTNQNIVANATINSNANALNSKSQGNEGNGQESAGAEIEMN